MPPFHPAQDGRGASEQCLDHFCDMVQDVVPQIVAITSEI